MIHSSHSRWLISGEDAPCLPVEVMSEALVLTLAEAVEVGRREQRRDGQKLVFEDESSD